MNNLQKMFTLLAEIRHCINDDRLMEAQRKVMAIEDILKSRRSRVRCDVCGAAPVDGGVIYLRGKYRLCAAHYDSVAAVKAEP